MVCLLAIFMGVVSSATIFFFGYPDWAMIVLGLLWLASLVSSAILGHHGFGGCGNTDLQFVIAGMFIAAAIIFPNYSSHKPCNQAKFALMKLAQAENDYFFGT